MYGMNGTTVLRLYDVQTVLNSLHHQYYYSFIKKNFSYSVCAFIFYLTNVQTLTMYAINCALLACISLILLIVNCHYLYISNHQRIYFLEGFRCFDTGTVSLTDSIIFHHAYLNPTAQNSKRKILWKRYAEFFKIFPCSKQSLMLLWRVSYSQNEGKNCYSFFDKPTQR